MPYVRAHEFQYQRWKSRKKGERKIKEEKQREEGKLHDSTNTEGILSAGEASFLKNGVKDEVSAEKTEQVEGETPSRIFSQERSEDLEP